MHEKMGMEKKPKEAEGSDSEDDLFAELCGVKGLSLGNVEIEEDEEGLTMEERINLIEMAVIQTDQQTIASVLNDMKVVEGNELNLLERKVFNLARLIAEGDYLGVLSSPVAIELFEKLIAAVDEIGLNLDDHICTVINKSLQHLLRTAEAKNYTNALLFALSCYWIGVAFLNVFVQSNYTGPSLEAEDVHSAFPNDLVKSIYPTLKGLDKESFMQEMHKVTNNSLQVDGELPYNICENSEFILLARCFLHFVGNSASTNWSYAKTDIDPSNSGNPSTDFHTKGIVPNEVDGFIVSPEIRRIFSNFKAATWWCLRSIVVHERLLLHNKPSNSLWYEAKITFSLTHDSVYKLNMKKRDTDLKSRLWLEWGLAEHYFNEINKGKLSFNKAKQISGLECHLTGLLGKRTKFQQKDVAQMVLIASSAEGHEVTSSKYAIASAETTHQDFGGLGSESNTQQEEGLVKSGEATYRTISREQGNPDDILLEDISFKNTDIEEKNLLVIDQVILLSLCLDVANSNPNDGLTREQMFPYVTRVLKNPNNWMVYSTGLLERAWLECETSRSKERAVLQMQALVDQHTTRLTITQSAAAIQDAAPAFERMEYIYSLAFPPRHSLKRGLAEKYSSLGVLNSAVEIFEELEVWDAVIDCYRALDKPKRAEAVVRERLASSPPSPFMLCCLGDLVGDPKYYHEAWELSNHHYARAKRSLARLAYEKDEKQDAIRHLQDSLKANPMNSSASFFLGSVAMQCSELDIALSAFTRVVQIEYDNGEAWGNIGSIHLQLNHFEEAFTAFKEGLKYKRHLWQMWENFMLCAAKSNKYGDVIYAFHQLLDLRDKHKRPVDHEILGWLVGEIIDLNNKPKESVEVTVSESSQSSNIHYIKQVAELLGRITSIISSNPKIWQVYGFFNKSLGRMDKATDCQLRECRSLQTAYWEKDEDKTEVVCQAVCSLAKSYIEEGSKKSLFSCRMYLNSVLEKARLNYPDLAACKELEEVLYHVLELEKQYQSK